MTTLFCLALVGANPPGRGASEVGSAVLTETDAAQDHRYATALSACAVVAILSSPTQMVAVLAARAGLALPVRGQVAVSELAARWACSQRQGDHRLGEGASIIAWLGACSAIAQDEAFTAPDGVLGVYTGWVEDHLVGRLAPQDLPDAAGELVAEQVPLRRLAVEVDGRRVVLGLPLDLARSGPAAPGPADDVGQGGEQDPAVPACPSVGILAAWLVEDGEHVEEGQDVARVEAMKMETTVAAHRAGRLVHGEVGVGAVLAADQALARIED